MSKVIESTVENPAEVIEQYVNVLNNYIVAMANNIKVMKNKHAEMGTVWRGEQYDRFTIVLNESLQDAYKELLKLQNLKEQLVKKAEALRKAQNN